MPSLRVKRGTAAQIAAAAGANGLAAGEPYLVTDTGRPAIGLSPTTYAVCALTGDLASYLPLAGGTLTGALTQGAGGWVTKAGSSGDNASRELLNFYDDRTDRYASIGTYRGASSQRIGLSFWGSFDAAPVERMRISDAGDLFTLDGDLYLGTGTIQSGNVPWARLTGVPSYALDSVVVKLTGDQSIAGAKTFTGSITAPVVNGPAAANLQLNAVTGQDVRLQINSDVKLQAQVEASGDNTTAASVKHANGSYYDVGTNVHPIIDLTGGDLTLARSHVGGLIRKWDTQARNLNIPASTDTSIPIGARFEYAGWNPGVVTLVAGSGTTISWLTGAGVTTGDRTFAQGAQVTIVRTDATRWFIWGVGIS